MDDYKTARTIRVIVGIVAILLVIIGVIVAARYIILNNEASNKDNNASQSSLLSLSADRSIRMNVRGEIVADEDFRSYQIEITPSYRAYVSYIGYAKQQADSITLPNNTLAYEQLVYALDHSKFMSSNKLNDDNNDTRGVCPSGKLYEFHILKNNKLIKTLWTSSCSSSKGSLRAGLSVITNLLYKQIPGVRSNIGKLWQ